MVNGLIATEADTTSLSEHTSDVQKQWELVSKMVCSEHECLSSATVSCRRARSLHSLHWSGVEHLR